MPYRQRPRDRPSMVGFSAGWLWLLVGLSLPCAALVLSDDLEPVAIATFLLAPAIALIFEIRRRRVVWERWQSIQNRGTHFEAAANGRKTSLERPRPWWQVLEISEQSTADDVKAAYYAKVKQFHPDTVMGLAKEFQELAERKTKEINEAYRLACRSHRTRLPRETQENQTGG